VVSRRQEATAARLLHLLLGDWSDALYSFWCLVMCIFPFAEFGLDPSRLSISELTEQSEIFYQALRGKGTMADAIAGFERLHDNLPKEDKASDKDLMPCANCAEMQRALTQVARENRSLEKRIVQLQAEINQR
jgi:hypothetical protein